MINTPVNQKRLTNVSVVRIKKGGKRFEIACYPNKVLSWREKVETDINEVLQTQTVFTNVSKGTPAKKADITKAFKMEDEQQICRFILDKGELQVGGKERQQMYENLGKDIATIISEKCVDPETKKPLTVGLVERAMKDLHYNVKPNKSAKVQALEVIKQLQKENIIPIERALMNLAITIPAKDSNTVTEAIQQYFQGGKLQEEWDGNSYSFDIAVDPGFFRSIDDIVADKTKGKGRVELLTLSETATIE